MIRKRLLYTGLFAAAWALPGCGSATSPSTGGVLNSNPNLTTGAIATRLDFTVDNNQTQSQSSDAGVKQNQIKSFILATVQSLGNANVDFQFTGFTTKPVAVPPPANSVHVGPADPSTPNTPTDAFVAASPIYATYTVSQPSQNAPLQARINSHLGSFDIRTDTYTPPPQILPDNDGFDNGHAPSGKPLDTFVLLATPEDPAIAKTQTAALLIHLNLSISISPVKTSVFANTAEAPAINFVQFTASVPGDGVRAPFAASKYNPADPTTFGQVKWSFVKQGGGAASSGSIDPVSGYFIAPQEPGVYTVTAQSLTQPDKTVSTDITVTQHTTTIGVR